MIIPAKDLLMGFFKQAIAGMGLIGCIWLLAGCAEVIVPGAFTGAGEAYRYNTSNVVKKTLMGDVGQVKAATRSALKKMDVHSSYFSDTICYIYLQFRKAMGVRIVYSSNQPLVNR